MDDDANVNNKKSLTRHNIFAINKKAKAIKLSLNEMARQSKFRDERDGFVPWRVLEAGGVGREEEGKNKLLSHEKGKSKDAGKLSDHLLKIDY